MEWIEPQFSRERVNKAGIALANSNQSNEDITVFHNWRSSHAYPMQVMIDFLRKNSLRIDKNSIVVQRLKRAPSIINKLRRESNMNLSRMEDIAGCRAILSNLNKVRDLHRCLKDSKTNNILYRERDYINNPKDSGYRGVHLVYRYNGAKDKFRNMNVELQIRTKIQHSWATAVEVIDTFTNQSLKSGNGDNKWLELFKCIGAEFSNLENFLTNKINDYSNFDKIMDLTKELHLFEKLSLFRISVKAITENLSNETKNKESYFLINLDLNSKTGFYRTFRKDELEMATNIYNEFDDSNQKNKDIVLVSAKSLKELKKAYPNYFVDTKEFEKNLTKVINIYTSK